MKGQGLVGRLFLGTVLAGGLAGTATLNSGCNIESSGKYEHALIMLPSGAIGHHTEYTDETRTRIKGKYEIAINNWALGGARATIVEKGEEGRLLSRYEVRWAGKVDLGITDPEGRRVVGDRIAVQRYDADGRLLSESEEVIDHMQGLQFHGRNGWEDNPNWWYDPESSRGITSIPSKGIGLNFGNGRFSLE